MTNQTWPELILEEWQDTLATLHMWTQIVGKIRLETDATHQSLVERAALCFGARADNVADDLPGSHLRN